MTPPPPPALCPQRCKETPLVEAPATPKLSLYVRWYSPTGKTKVNNLALKPIEGVESLEVRRAVAESDAFVMLKQLATVHNSPLWRLCSGQLSSNASPGIGGSCISLHWPLCKTTG